ncbi:hypothetical protein THIOSC15_3460002 [uncultured Thiomicrorhabdus sp.]
MELLNDAYFKQAHEPFSNKVEWAFFIGAFSPVFVCLADRQYFAVA